MPSKRMTGINRAERSPDSGALSALLLPHLFLLLQLHASLSTSTSTPTSSPVHPLHFALSWSTGLLKLPRWPLYLQHWSAQTFFFRKRPFWAVNRCAETCKTHLDAVLELQTHTHTSKNYHTSKCSIVHTDAQWNTPSVYCQSLHIDESDLLCSRAHMSNICVYIPQMFLYCHVRFFSAYTHPETMYFKSNNNALWQIYGLFPDS